MKDENEPLHGDSVEKTAASPNSGCTAPLPETWFGTRYVLWLALQRLFGTAPTKALWDSLCSEEVIECIRAYPADGTSLDALATRLEYMRDGWDSTSSALAKRQYSQLFETPNPPSIPWEGAREGLGLLFDRKTIEVRNAYAEAGFAPAMQGRVPDDHLALECAFMAETCSNALTMESGREELPEGARSLKGILESQKSFLEKHLGRWIGSYADEISQAMPESLYADAAEALRELCAQEAKQLERHLEVMDAPDGISPSESIG